MNNYILGLLYGDGSFTRKDNREWYSFFTTHKELADIVKSFLDDNNISYNSYSRDHVAEYKEKWEILEIVEITDKDFNNYLVDVGFKSEYASERIKWNPDFIRGYLETKGTLFSYMSRNSLSWRIALSGNEEDLEYLKYMIESRLDIKTSKLVHRKEREDQGIISKSFRFYIQNREGLVRFIRNIDNNEKSEYLRDKIDSFFRWDNETPFNMKRKVFKHYKYAVGFMCRELDIEIKGVRGGGGEKGWKPVYLFFDGEIQDEYFFKGWEEAYNWVRDIYKDETGHNYPLVEAE